MMPVQKRKNIMTFRMWENFINKETTAAAAAETQKTNEEEALMIRTNWTTATTNYQGLMIRLRGSSVMEHT